LLNPYGDQSAYGFIAGAGSNTGNPIRPGGFMSDQNSVVAVYNSHAEAEQALEKLKAASFDLKKVSIVGKDFRSEEKMVGYYTTGDHMKYWVPWALFGDYSLELVFF
jgi:hypothetical protein